MLMQGVLIISLAKMYSTIKKMLNLLQKFKIMNNFINNNHKKDHHIILLIKNEENKFISDKVNIL